MAAEMCRYNRSMTLSIIIPTLNEAGTIQLVLARLQTLRSAGAEIIVVDGGSHDRTAEFAKPLAAPLVDHMIISDVGRARQMNAGARISTGEVLLFLHADTLLPADADLLILQGLAKTNRSWGRFDVTIAGDHFFLGVIGWCMNLRSRLTGIATGDQAIFMTRTVFDQLGGFPDQALMEDIEMTSRLKKKGAPLCVQARVVTSGRRWEQHGVWRTILLMWRLRLQYFLGAKPSDLHRTYYKNS